MTGHRLAAAALVAIVPTLLGPARASAQATCDYAASGNILEVRITQSNALAQIERSGSNIQVRDASGPVACSSNPPGLTPTVTTTDSISASSEVDVVNTALIIDDAAGLAPGSIDETGDDEIEVYVNLRNGASSLLSVRIGDFPGNFRWGTSGINPNASAGEVDPDADIIPSNVPEMDGRGGFATPANFDAQGGAGTGGPLATPITFEGSGAADTLIGGEGNDALDGFTGADQLQGRGGDDMLDPGPSDDTLDGGPGTDTADYLSPSSSEGVIVDLERAGPQPTGGSGGDAFTGIENIRGTFLGDTLRGDGGPNIIEGMGGADIVDGRGGADDLQAGPGNDAVEARDGVADSVDCGDDDDTATVDAAPIDVVAGCESVLFPPGTPPPTDAGSSMGTGQGEVSGGEASGGEASGGAASTGAAGGQSGTGGAVIRSLRVAPSAFAALRSGPSARPAGARGRPGGATVLVNVDRRAAITYRVARRRAGRQVGRQCAAPTRANRGRRPCTRYTAVRGSFSRRTAAGTSGFRFTGRIRGRRLARGRYQLRATPRARGQTGKTARAAFRITR